MNKQIPNSRIEFVIDDSHNSNSGAEGNGFYLTKDKSLLYQSKANGDYSLLLNGNWRFELIVDSSTGLCVKFQSFLDELKVLRKSLMLPKPKLRRVFIKGDETPYPGGGCHYYPFADKVFWDETKNILCIGDPDAVGDVIEFTPQITMVIKNFQLVCLYLSLNGVAGMDFL